MNQPSIPFFTQPCLRPKFIFCALRPAADPMLRLSEMDWSFFFIFCEACHPEFVSLFLDCFLQRHILANAVVWVLALVYSSRFVSFMHVIILCRRPGDWSWLGSTAIIISSKGIDINSDINSSTCMYVRIQNTLNTYIICNIIKLYTLNAYHIFTGYYILNACVYYIYILYACIPRPEWQTWGGSVPYDLSRASIRCKGKAMFHPPASGRLPRDGEPPPKKNIQFLEKGVVHT